MIDPGVQLAKFASCVDEYEPEIIVLQIRGRRGVGDILRRVVDAASFHAKRLRVPGDR